MGFRQLIISDHAEMKNEAATRANMDGPWQETKVHFHDHFTDDTLSTDKWLATVTNHTIAVNHATNRHCVLFTTDTTDNESSFLATPLCWEDDQNAVAEFRFKVSDVSAVCLFVGFSDATFEATPDMPIDYAGGTLAAAATNAVGIVMDGDDTVNGASSIVGVGVNAGVLETAKDSATDWLDGEWHTLRTELDPDGDAVFYLDGNSFGQMPTAITSATALCVIIAVANRGTSVETVYGDRVDAWQDEET
jgi:hypothetical protein